MAIVVVNYGSHRLLADGLARVALPDDGFRVVVVDNFSSAAERDAIGRLCARHRAGRSSRSRHNAGFGAGVNAGARHALAGGAGSVLMLNPDVDLTPDVLVALRDQVEGDPMSVVTPRLVTPGRRGRVRRVGPGPVRRPARPAGDVRDGDRVAAGHLPGRAPRPAGPGRRVRRAVLPVLGGRRLQLSLHPGRRPAGGARGPRRRARRARHAGPAAGLAKSNLYYRYNCRNRLLFAARHLPRRELARWMVRTPVASWRILLQGGRRQLLHSPRPLLAALAGTLAGLGIATRALIRGPG